jgi:hypothetical protein
MTTLPMFTDSFSDRDDTPFPLLIAKRFDFPLAYHERGDEIYYCIQDWVRGLTSVKDVRQLLSMMKRSDIYPTMLPRIQKLPYASINSKTYKVPFTTSQNLIQIMNYLRTTSSRPVLSQAKMLFIARIDLGWKLQLSRLARKTFFDYDIDQLDLDPEEWESDDFLYYHMTDLERNYHENYFKSQLLMPHLIEYCGAQIKDKIKPEYYDIITIDIYKGLWDRTPQQLKIQLGAPSVYAIKMHMTVHAHLYHHFVYEVVRSKLMDKEVWWYEIRHTVQEAVKKVRFWTEDMSQILGKDLATGRPLLP